MSRRQKVLSIGEARLQRAVIRASQLVLNATSGFLSESFCEICSFQFLSGPLGLKSNPETFAVRRALLPLGRKRLDISHAIYYIYSI